MTFTAPLKDGRFAGIGLVIDPVAVIPQSSCGPNAIGLAKSAVGAASQVDVDVLDMLALIVRTASRALVMV